MKFMSVQSKNSEVIESVVLLHGMGRSSRSMDKIANSLKCSGYNVINISYPSTKKPITVLITDFIKPQLDKLKKISDSKIHFVAHSLGGILVRLLLQTEKLPHGSRIIMLSPPNHGSEIVDRYKNTWWYKRINGSAGQELGTTASSLPNQLRALNYSIGVITGKKSYEPWFSRLMLGDDDGKVSVKSAMLDEMDDFLVVECGHTFIMQNRDVINHIKQFIICGCFKL